jgi:hypothetical protein
MAHPHTIALADMEKAVAAAVHQLQHQKAHSSTDLALAKSSLIMGRWIRQANIPHAEADAAAREITAKVTSQVAGLKATPFSNSGPGGTTMGFVLQEE